MRKTILLVAVIALLFSFMGFRVLAERKYTIGFATAVSTSPYGSQYNQKLKEFVEAAGHELIMADADLDLQRQINQIADLASKVDGLIVMPVEAKAVVPAIKEAKQEYGIPIVTGNVTTDPVVFPELDGVTGPDCYSEGEVAATATDMALDDLGKETGGKVVMITGTPGYSAAEDRKNGFLDKMKELRPDLNVLDIQNGDWHKDIARRVTENLMIKYGEEIDVIYAHDDTMAAGVSLGLEAQGYQPGDLWIVGIGGNQDGLDNIQAGWQFASIFQSPTADAKMAVDILLKVLNEGPLEEKIHWIETPIITRDNVDNYYPPEY